MGAADVVVVDVHDDVDVVVDVVAVCSCEGDGCARAAARSPVATWP